MIKRKGRAFFVPDPRVVEDLIVPHRVDDERQYQIVKTIVLGNIDYENFVTDMVADRQFIEQFAHLCGKGDIWRCLYVHKRSSHDGVLVMPEDGSYVGWAALPQKDEESSDEQEFDAVLKLLLADVMEAEGAYYTELNERLQRDPTAAVPKELDERMQRLIAEQLSKPKNIRDKEN